MENRFSWLNYDEVNNIMVCTYCEDYKTLAGQHSFFTGSNTFHISNTRAHDTYTAHLICRCSTNDAKCERRFSRMKQLKTPLRNILNQQTLQSLLRVSMVGPLVKSYNPSRDVGLYFSLGQQGLDM